MVKAANSALSAGGAMALSRAPGMIQFSAAGVGTLPFNSSLAGWEAGALWRGVDVLARIAPVASAVATVATVLTLVRAALDNPTRQAIFEYDRLVRSIYTLRYLRDPQLERNIRRSQNRVESYHQLRAAVAKVGGKKELTGKNDIETDISNQCGRLISNAIIYYNSAILSRLLERLEAEDNTKGVEVLTRISPVAWQHILLNGHYTFQSSNELIDLDTLVAGLKLA
ncbi:Tn3 family transposase [Klebsiella aerogenes]|uniref:Tn3 family transposase n=1 Tax=Klebsiella aerogenes TaxID=548 RepID=UPI00404434F7